MPTHLSLRFVQTDGEFELFLMYFNVNCTTQASRSYQKVIIFT